MAGTDLTVSPVVRARAALLGARGAAWLRDLPSLVRELEQRWSITIGEALSGGTAAYVARARTGDGVDAVVKLAVPAADFALQVRTIAAARGRGYVALLAHDEDRHAVLMESLGPSLDRLGLAPHAQLSVLCDMLPTAWQTPPAPGGPGQALNKALQLGEMVDRYWRDLDPPCSALVRARAMECAERRAAAFCPERCVVVHGDPNPANALQARTARPGAEAGFVFVDPDGFLGDRTYDLGVALRDWCPQLLGGEAAGLARSYCHLLATRTGSDEAAVWDWGFLERVSTGLHALALGAPDLGRPFLNTAELLG